MIDPHFENFLSCYLETLQVIPQQMQSEISCYLQSDLQHQHLLNVCSGCIDDLKRVSCSSEQLLYSKKLVMCLAGIQDICDRRASLITEMYDVLENQAQKLMDLQDKMLSCNSQSETSAMDHHLISTERDADCPEDQKFTAQDISTKHLLERSELDSKTTHSVSLRRKARTPFRTRSQLGVVSASHRAFPAWERGSRSSHNTKPALPTHSQVNRSSKNRCTGESRLVDKPHPKKPNSFSRYARAQQQRMQNQRRQQQRALCRRTQDVRTRVNAVSTTGARLSSKPNLKAQQYLKRAGNLDRKFLRIASSSRSPARRDTDLIGDYFTDDPTTRSASNATSEDETENQDCDLPTKRGSLRGSPWIQTGDRSSDDIEDDEHTDDSSATGISLQLHEVKNYFGKERRESPHPGTSRNYVANRRQFVRQHKPSTTSASNPRPTLNRSTVTRDKLTTSSNNNNKRRHVKLSRFRPCPRSASRNVPASHPPNRRESPVVKKKTGTVRTVLNRSPAEGRTTDTSTDQSSDERLYCWCKKIAFGDMIACDNKQCKVEWFHFACVGISAQPKGKWYCPLCRGESSKIKRSN